MKKESTVLRYSNTLRFALWCIKYLTIFLLLENGATYAQPLPRLDNHYNIETFDESKGLYNKDVYGFVFDRNGLGWIGNTDGLHIFDGKRVYKVKDYIHIDNPLLQEQVKALIYDKEKHKLIVFSFAKDKTNIYVLHLDRLNQKTSQPPLTLMLSRFGPLVKWPIYDGHRISCIINSIPTFLDIKNFCVVKTQLANLIGMVFFKNRQNQLLLCARDGYTYLVSNVNGKVHLKYVFKYTVDGARVMAHGVMFSHPYSPLNITLSNKKWIDDIVQLNSNKKYSIGSFQGLVEDSFGNFYLCSRDWGIQKLSVDRPLAKKIKCSIETRAIYYNKKKDQGWVGTPRGVQAFSLKIDTILLANWFKNESERVFYYQCSVAINDSLTIFFPLYPQNDPLHRATLLNKNTNKIKLVRLQYPNAIHNSDFYLQFTISTCKKMADGTIYLGTNHGLCSAQYDGQTIIIKPINIRNNDNINGVLESPKPHHLLLATELGLYEVDLITKTEVQLQQGSFVSLLRHPDGWIAGSRQAGAYFFDNHNQVIRQLNTDNGLNSNTVYSIMYDPKFYTIWFGTGNGLTMYHLKNNLLKTYFEKDGLVHNEFNRESTYMVQGDTLMLMGGIAGISAIYNRNYFFSDADKIKPLVWGIDATYDSNQHLFSYLSSGEKALTFSHKLRKLIFHVANFASKQQLFGVLYRVDDGKWLNLKQGEDIELLDVDAGKHILEIRAMTADGKVSPVRLIEYEVSQIWYKSWWGISLFTLLGALSMVPVFLIRNRIVQVKAKEELYKNREKLFGMIAHDLRSPLSAYQGLADVIKYLIEKQDWERLQIIGKEIDDTGRHLDLMLNNLLNWSLIQQKELKSYFVSTDLRKILQDLLPVYQTLAKAKDINLLVDVEQHTTLVIDRNLSSLVIRNLLDNAVKNAPEGSFIKMKINKEAQNMVILIENDFLANSLPIINEIVNNINTPNWELQRGVGLKFVIQALNLMQATTEVTIVGNFNRLRWYIKIPCL
ncbi:sensor histidine kinase [Flectobacillus rivi]|uniref:histidine kinase n=1 Tax=Flectobacillus rivi TaxID=2984209 RepID=A0ABT6Z0N1_9BACT|nr:HAMP domain-containing sensor histidine kinase [Flectobacillus rivi]MDI9874698.1 HAMP domain-containing sensor histidine kinase [Flectobacillus rivi]